MKRSGAIVAMVFAAMLEGQPVSVGTQQAQRARELLDSPQWVDKAWGVFIAAGLHSGDLQARLLEQFRYAVPLRNSQPWSDEHAFVDALFDAAIDAGVPVPADLIEPFVEHWTTPVLILLARAGDGEDTLLKLRGGNFDDMVWLAANDVLAERKSQKWYSALWQEIHITHRFIVTDRVSDWEFGRGSGGGIGGGSCGDGVVQLPKDYPPTGLYGLTDLGGRGSVLVTKGPRDIYYNRTVVPANGQAGIGNCTGQVDRGATRIGYLAGLRGDPADVAARQIHAETGISYTNHDAFLLEAEQSVREQSEYIRALIRAGESRGFRPPDLPLRIVPEVIDRRTNPKDSLPIPGARDIDTQR